jgi:hypothetical protein
VKERAVKATKESEPAASMARKMRREEGGGV